MTLGKKIQKLRKQQGLSQEELAEKIIVTRQTISKWELDQSTPDLAFITQLSDFFGVSADYLIREELDEPDALLMPKKKEFHITERVKHRILIALSATAMIAIFVCLTCDYFTSEYLQWSLIATVSIVLAWCLCVPIFIAKSKIILKMLITVSVLVIPYLLLLGFLLKQSIVFKVGACVSVVTLAAVWLIYWIFQKCRSRLWRGTGFAMLVVIPVAIIINHVATYFVSQGEFDMTSDLFNSIITFMLAIICFGIDYLQNRKRGENAEENI